MPTPIRFKNNILPADFTDIVRAVACGFEIDNADMLRPTENSAFGVDDLSGISVPPETIEGTASLIVFEKDGRRPVISLRDEQSSALPSGSGGPSIIANMVHERAQLGRHVPPVREI